jgi:hypothetical protein
MSKEINMSVEKSPDGFQITARIGKSVYQPEPIKSSEGIVRAMAGLGIFLLDNGVGAEQAIEIQAEVAASLRKDGHGEGTGVSIGLTPGGVIIKAFVDGEGYESSEILDEENLPPELSRLETWLKSKNISDEGLRIVLQRTKQNTKGAIKKFWDCAKTGELTKAFSFVSEPEPEIAAKEKPEIAAKEKPEIAAKEIPPHQQRVVREYQKLAKKMEALGTFTEENPVFKTLEPREQELMHHQYLAMRTYHNILGERLARWGITPTAVGVEEIQAIRAEVERGGFVARPRFEDIVNAFEFGLTEGMPLASTEVDSADWDTVDDAHRAFADFAKQIRLTYGKNIKGVRVIPASRDRESNPKGTKVRFQAYIDPATPGGDKSVVGEYGIPKSDHKEAIIRRAKELRVAIDVVLQDVKAFGKDCLASPCIDAPSDAAWSFKDPQEVPANIKLSQRALEDAVMRLGMCMKAVGTPTPYPNSYNPDNAIVEPTADGLKL